MKDDEKKGIQKGLIIGGAIGAIGGVGGMLIFRRYELTRIMKGIVVAVLDPKKLEIVQNIARDIVKGA